MAQAQAQTQDAREPFPAPPLVPSSSRESGSQPLTRPRNGTSETSRSRPALSSSTAGTNGSVPQSQTWTLPVRTLPPWIRSVDTSEDEPDATTKLLPTDIRDALVAQHNHSPYEASERNNHTIAIKLESDGLCSTAAETRQSRWRLFTQSAAYPHTLAATEEKRVSFDWLNNNLGDYSQPWNGSNHAQDAELGRAGTWAPRRRNLMQHVQSQLLRSPIVPLILRLIVWIFSLCALALGGSIYYMSSRDRQHQGSSAIMAIVVDAVALVYLVYITYDEYFSKPLGLRSPKAKVRLILLDLFFIVFDAANLSLAFESLSNVTGSCTDDVINEETLPKRDPLCDRQKALASVLLVALIAWLLTFCVCVLRVVERVSK